MKSAIQNNVALGIFYQFKDATESDMETHFVN